MRKFSPPKLMGHIVAGYPNVHSSIEAALGICDAGASYLEVQFPFSDPSADGPVIEQACNEVLANGFRTREGFNLIDNLNKKLKTQNLPTKLIIITYANVVYSYGVKKFVNNAKKAGAWGIIVPDLPLEDDEGLREFAKEIKLNVISIITPITPNLRSKHIATRSDKIVYAMARSGITGDKTLISRELRKWLANIKKGIKKPIALGFGIASNEQVRSIGYSADIIVAGSYFVRFISENANHHDLRQRLKNHANNLMQWDSFPPPIMLNEKPERKYKKKDISNIEYRRVVRNDVVVEEEPPRKVFYIERRKK